MIHAFIDLINAASHHWAAWMIAATLNSAALLVFVSAVWFLIRRHAAPQVGYCLFLLVPLKLLLPLNVSLPSPIARWTPTALASTWVGKVQGSTVNSAQPTTESASAVSASRGAAANGDFPPLTQGRAAGGGEFAGRAPTLGPADATFGLADAARPRISIAATVMLAWLSVVALLCCRWFHSQRRFNTCLLRATPIDGRQIRIDLPDLLRLAGIRRAVRLVESDDIAAPAVSGIVRPTVILPRGIANVLTTCQLRWSFLHELSHVRRWDILAVFLQRCVTIVHFFNPAAWIANKFANRLREYVCDDFALSTSESSAIESGQAFLEVLRYASASRRMQRALGIFGFDSRTSCTLRVRRLLDGERLIRTRASVFSMCGIVALAIVALPYVRAATDVENGEVFAAPDKSPATLTGSVKSADGQPIAGALVTIYSAGVRIGSSPFCPTCYADCGKRATTAADGAFTIEKLDPSLVFRVLVIKKGFEPKFVAKVDPVKSKEMEVSLKARSAVPSDRTHMVSGQIISPAGQPLAGALVEPFGCKIGDRRWWGGTPSMPGVDALAVTDDDGHFDIVTAEPVDGLDLEISARAVATKKFELVPSNNTENRLQLSAGASIAGRVLDHGKPLPNVLIGLSQVDRGIEKYISAIQIGTNADGEFLFTNVPADRDYFIYGIATSLQKHGAVVARRIKVENDNTKTDVGDLVVEPAFHITGRVALSDGKPLPAHTRVLISREDAWDTQIVQADENGKFKAVGIPREVMSIVATAPKYQLSKKNKSYEPLNGFAVQGLITADVDGLTILLEPGTHKMPGWPTSPVDQRAMMRTVERLKKEPPIGVSEDLQSLVESEPDVITAAPTKPPKPLPKISIPAPVAPLPAADADVPQRKVIGRVSDQDGNPVAGAEVFLPVRWTSAANCLTAHAKSTSDGSFELRFPAEWVPDDRIKLQSTVWAYAKGHSIGIGKVFKQLQGKNPNEPCDIQLGPSVDTKFAVLLPDGRPAVHVQVKPLHFLGSQGYEYVPSAIVDATSTTTDSEGHVALPAYPIEKLLNVLVVSDDLGTQQFQNFGKSNNSSVELNLLPVGRIEGHVLADQPELFRNMFIFIETRNDPTGATECTGQAIPTIDKDGKFVIPHMAAGMIALDAQVDDRLPVRPRLPGRRDLEVLPGKTTRVETPLEMTVQVHGLIRIKGSDKLVSGASISVNYGTGRQSESATSDIAGKYSARVLPGKVGTQVIAVLNENATQLMDSRSARVDVPENAADFELPTIELTPTKTLSGKLLDSAGNPLAKRRLSGVNGNGRYGFGESDENGNFKLADVPEGLKLEKFEVWPDGIGSPLESIIDSTDPLVVRLK